ncbi:hypothetical protein [Granulicella sp. dw_53]|uniref:hypothetical protein n=1 Tax=Granulicella sp. dw_53 TaxID=2719792 RepID=UPI001BD27737|nr:hypothetical protein [Granulicella sp. dw_53]
MSTATLDTELCLDGGASVLPDDSRWQLTVRVAESSRFKTSSLLSQFLLFICEMKLSGREDELTEQIIGERVFRRRPGYSTGEDNIVRTYAHRLRARLEEYFDSAGQAETMRIQIPRGGYAPEFVSCDLTLASIQGAAVKDIEPTQSVAEVEVKEATAQRVEPLARKRVSRWIVLASMLLVAGPAVLWWRTQQPPPSPAHTLWKQMFSSSSRTYLVTTDNGLGVLQDLSGKYASLNDYLDGSYFAQFDQNDTEEHRKLSRLSRERLTSVPDSAAAASLLTLPEAKGKTVLLRNARALQLNDLKQTNLVLLGSTYGDPWVSLFEPQMNFQMNYHADPDTYESEIVNRHPRSGEQATYRNSSTVAPYTTYAVVALVPNLDKTGWVLIVEGLTMAGTEAAIEYLMHSDAEPFLKEASNGSGGLRPFEVTLKTTSFDSESSSSTLLLKRIY